MLILTWRAGRVFMPMLHSLLLLLNFLMSQVGWAGFFAHRLHRHFIPRGHEQHVPTLPGWIVTKADRKYEKKNYLRFYFFILAKLLVTMKILKKPMYFILLLAFIFEVLVYTGFCFKQFRYISKEEKVRIAIAYVLEENRKSILEYKDRAVIFPFSTVDEFFASKPTIMETAYSLGPGGEDCLDRLVGNLSSYVVLEFMSLYKNKPHKVLTDVAITNCGKARNTFD
jgi:hypothetical protein